ncbi:LamG-like jellyroll fold domain-containing protein [Pedosphaera parvula]|uniref:Alpha-tubulin suppressor and related RCC1 domain-containing protein-like protein n=1 Tax=Pedosphaera parvula (strain Ellin514) TaxID=320771 RepID=B9XJI0_PEDPL|nr:LamG-like jellyroll fold domain-containing protein [Pedosphaera parvula]EEF60041.1 Alpha-tubulin suppressor and related RCC1 domain-containing protein-like protein [Pedosphaera parvula Ellin514]
MPHKSSAIAFANSSIRILLWFAVILLAHQPILQAQELNWPTNQFLPTFPTPATNIDCIDVSSSTGAEIDLFASLQGIVNRTQPRVANVSSVDSEGKFIWLTLHNLPYTLINGYDAITKYRTNFNGLVVTDTNQPDTLNLATTIAGVSNLLICDPSLLVTLTNAPYNLPIAQDLRTLHFTDKYKIYGYLYTNYWPQCTHRMIAGLAPDLHGELRDYLVATKCATVWLDPGTLNFSDKSTLTPFLNDMKPLGGIYVGWWPSEGNGLGWIAQYGIPVLASDFFRNASVFSGIPRQINVPSIPPPPPLTNKVYVSLILSDGDNIQYMQHVMKIDWDKPARGTIPIGWTVSPLAVDLDPVMLNHYWSSATTNDCLISGPSGAGYCHIQNWSSANLAALTKVSDAYLQRAGIKVITVWDQVTTGVARAFATNCPTLLGLTDQSGGNYTSVNLGLRTRGLAVSYSSTASDIISGITNAAASFNGTAPMFIAAQAVVWSLGPSDLVNIANSLDTNKYVLVRPDHLFLLNNQVYGYPTAVTKSATGISLGKATLQGLVNPNSANAIGWFEWGKNKNYGFRTASTNLSGTSGMPLASEVSGLLPGVVYHYRVASSNALGVVWGAEKTFSTGGRVKAWGDGSLGQTNIPSGLTNAIGISAGANHGLALKSDGTVTAWGYNSFNQTNVPASLTNVVQVSGGIQHSLALDNSGTVSAWGDGTLGQTTIPNGLTNVIEVAAGGYHNLALKADGTVTAWGSNTSGQTNVPAGLSNVVSIAAGRLHSLALKADGTISAWGDNSNNQTNVPAGLKNVVAISAGDYHSLALKADGNSSSIVPADERWVADNLAGTNGASIASWQDSVGFKTAVQASQANQPQLFTNAIGGHNVLRFSSANNQFLSVTSGNSVISGAGDFSMVVLFRTSTPGLGSGSFFQNTGILGAEQQNIVADWALCLNGNQLGGGLGASAGGCSADSSFYGGSVADGKPHIAMYVRSADTARLYVDGAIVSAQNTLCTAPRGNYDFQIGAMTTSSGFFDGDIAEIQLYRRALNGWEMTAVNQTLANTYALSGFGGVPVTRWVADTLSGSDGSAISSWPDKLAGRNAGQTTSARQPKLFSNVINHHKTVRFNSAANQYLTVSATDSPVSAMGSFTLLVVFKTSTPGSSSGLFYQNTGLLGCEQSGVVQDWALCLNGSQLGAGLGGGTSGCGSDLGLYGGSVTDGNPHIGAYVRTGGTIELFVDGVLVASQSSLCPAARGAYPFQIGAMTSSSLFFNGDIAEIQIFDRGLSSMELNSINQNLASTYGIRSAAGQLVAWGNNGSGQTTVPTNGVNIASAASGSAFNLAIKNDGGFLGWGNNASGQTGFLPGLTNVATVAGGLNFALAIANQTPLVNNASFSGFLNHDLTFALPGVDPDGNPLGFKLTSLPANGSLYQYDAGTRGALIASPTASVIDPAGRLIFAPAPDAVGNPYANFAFMAQDAYYSSGSAQVTLNINYPAQPQFSDWSYQSANDSNAGFSLHFTGSPSATYSIWTSENLVDWTKLGTATEPSAGQYLFTDAATNSPQRFYRAGTP